MYVVTDSINSVAKIIHVVVKRAISRLFLNARCIYYLFYLNYDLQIVGQSLVRINPEIFHTLGPL